MIWHSCKFNMLVPNPPCISGCPMNIFLLNNTDFAILIVYHKCYGRTNDATAAAWWASAWIHDRRSPSQPCSINKTG